MKIEISNDKSRATIDGVEYTRKGKKISEWLNELPDGYRELALANFKEQGREDIIAKYKYDAIHNLGDWGKTKEGDKLWLDIYNHYYRGSQLPPLPKPKFEVWKPKVGDKMWVVDAYGNAMKGRFSNVCKNYPYLIFQTKEQALEAHEKAMFNYEVEMFIKEKNEGWLPDWTDFRQEKFKIVCENDSQTITMYRAFGSKHTSDYKHFKSTEIGEEIIAKFDNDKLVKYWI
jgi:hypothetical protein